MKSERKAREGLQNKHSKGQTMKTRTQDEEDEKHLAIVPERLDDGEVHPRPSEERDG
jgi:hypothetical protein